MWGIAYLDSLSLSLEVIISKAVSFTDFKVFSPKEIMCFSWMPLMQEIGYWRYLIDTNGYIYEGISKSFWTESIMKYTLTFGITRWEATQRVMAAKLVRLTHKTVIQLHLVAETCTICSSCSRWPVG
jgi:hypothetical protein